MATKRAETYDLRRRDVARRLLSAGRNALIVTGLGAVTWDFAAAGDRDLTFPLWGAMGGAVPIGLGLALARPDARVLVVTGDGEMLMGLGSLATVAVKAPPNLAIAVFDNERYGETGMQATHTAHATDLEAVARGCGIADAMTVRNQTDLDAASSQLTTGPGPVFCVIKVRAEDLEFVLPPKNGVHLKDRFRSALGVSGK
jgi:thiamine pyrophosphate-dependent acetolactate synthase large subunit-like protein